MKVALVYDRINKFGGAERVLMALHELWPKAPIFTAVYDSKGATWAKGIEVIPSFLNKIPFLKTRHELLPWITPFAFELFDFSAYDLVISVTSAEAKSIITAPHTTHICYCLTPTRYLWSHTASYQKQGYKGKLLKLLAPSMRKTDYLSAQRPDYMLAISNEVSQRIQKYYKRPTEVIYPPVVELSRKTSKIISKPANKPSATSNLPQDYYLLVARLVSYKRIDLAIKACLQLDKNLIIIGIGSQQSYLKTLAGPKVIFEQDLTDEQLSHYYMHCRAVIFPGHEDFGIVPVEAQMHGKPVIAFHRGGAGETVIHNQTGILFTKQTVKSLKAAILQAEKKKFSAATCLENARKYSKKRFQSEFKKYISSIYKRKTI
jgi:glycosyltransferase involved in cell wall biosynthesis